MSDEQKGMSGGDSADADMAAAYQSFATDAGSAGSQAAPANDGASIQQSAVAQMLHRRAGASLVYKQLWVILFTLIFVFMGVTFVPWSGLEDTSGMSLQQAANMESRARALSVDGLTEDSAQFPKFVGDNYTASFAAVVKGTHQAGYKTGRGAIVFFVTFWAICACILGVYTNRFLLVPTATAFLTNLVVVASRLLGVFQDEEVRGALSGAFSGRGIDAGFGIVSDIFGPGFFFVALGSLFIPVYLVLSAVSGAKDSKKQAPARGKGKGASASRVAKPKK